KSGNDGAATKAIPNNGDKQPLILPLPVGTAFNAELTTPLDTNRSRAGDTFSAQVTENVKYERSIVIPRGTVLMGHLVRASAKEQRGQESALFLQFEKAILPSAEEAVLSAGIQAMAPKRDGRMEDQADRLSDAGEEAAEIE